MSPSLSHEIWKIEFRRACENRAARIKRSANNLLIRLLHIRLIRKFFFLNGQYLKADHNHKLIKATGSIFRVIMTGMLYSFYGISAARHLVSTLIFSLPVFLFRSIEQLVLDFLEVKGEQAAFARKALDGYYVFRTWRSSARTFTSYPRSKAYHPAGLAARYRLLRLTLIRKLHSGDFIDHTVPNWVQEHSLLRLEWHLAEIETLIALGRVDDGHEKFDHLSKINPAPTPTESAFLHDAAKILKRDTDALAHLRNVVSGPNTSFADHHAAVIYCRRAGFAFDAEKIIAKYPDYLFEIEELAMLSDSIVDDANFVRNAETDPMIGGQAGFSPHLPEALVYHIISNYRSNERANFVPGRVLIINSSLAPGGAERQIATTVRGIKAATSNLESIHFAARWVIPVRNFDFYLPHIRSEGLAVSSLMKTPLTEIERALYEEFPERASDIELLKHLSDDLLKTGLAYYLHILRTKPEVVHLWQDQTNIVGGIAALLAGTPRILLSTRSLRPTKHSRIHRYLFSGYLALLQDPRVTLLNNSNAGAADYGHWLNLDPGRFEVIYNGVDVANLANNATPQATAAVRQQLKIPRSAFVVGGVMRMSSEKRPDLWMEVTIRLAKRNPEMHFILIGDGPMFGRLEKRVTDEQLANRIHLPGTAQPVEPWMANMDTLFSSSEIEGLPNVIIEAQGLGIPVIATNAGGSSEALIDGVTGYIGQGATPDEYVALAEKIASDPNWRKTATAKARQFITDRFDQSVMANQTCSAYGLSPAAGEDKR